MRPWALSSPLRRSCLSCTSWAFAHKGTLAAVAAGLAMRLLYRFWGGGALEHDERFTYMVAALPWDRFAEALLYDVHPPLYYILAKLLNPHLVSLASSVAAAFGIRALAERIRPGSGDWALAAYMLWPAMAQEGSMARMYPLLHALSAWALARDSAFLWGLAASTHHLAWPAAGAWWLLRSRRPGALLAMLAAGAPGLAFLAVQASRPHFSVENRHGIYGSLVLLLFQIGPAVAGPLLGVTVVGGPAALAAAGLWLWRRERRLLWIGLAPGLYGWTGHLMLPRYWGASMPILAAAFGGLMREERRFAAFFAALAASSLLGGPLPFREPPPLPEARCYLMISTDTWIKLADPRRDFLFREWDVGAGLHPRTVAAMGIPLAGREEALRRGCRAAWVEPYGPSPALQRIAASLMENPVPLRWGGGTIWIGDIRRSP